MHHLKLFVGGGYPRPIILTKNLSWTGALKMVGSFGGLSLASLLFQALITRKHIELGNDQLDFIEQYHREDVSRQMRDIANG